MGLSVEPAGDGVTLLYTSIVLLVLCWVIFSTRVAVRVWRQSLGTDDYLMFAGLLLFTVTASLCIVCSFLGSGQKSAVLTTPVKSRGTKLFFIAEFFYASGAVFIKCSIAVTLIRIADSRRRFVYTLWAVMIATAVSAVIFNVTIANICHPIATLWGDANGTCNLTMDTDVSLFFSAVEITTDLTLAVLPAVLLWNVQMKARVKLSVGLILGMAAFASAATIVRLRYLSLYSDPTEFMYSTGKIGLWSVIETGIGILAGSFPALRPLLSHPVFGHSQSASREFDPDTADRLRPSRKKRPTRTELALETFQPLEDENGDAADGDSQTRIWKQTKVTVMSNDEGAKRGEWERRETQKIFQK